MKRLYIITIFFVGLYCNGLAEKCISKVIHNQPLSNLFAESLDNDYTCDIYRSSNRPIGHAPYLLPFEGDSIMYVNLNLFFMQKDDGTGNFRENNAEEQSLINDAIDNLNYRYSHIILPDSDNCYDDSIGELLHDTKIRFIAHKYYIKNTYLWDNHHDSVLVPRLPLNSDTYHDFCPGNNWYLDSLDWEVCHDNSIPRGINVYFTEAPALYNMCWILNEYDTTIYSKFPGALGACALYPTYNNSRRTSRIHMIEMYSKYWWMKNIVPTLPEFGGVQWESAVRQWMYETIGQTLAHEIGHVFNLYHPIEDDLCYMHHNCFNAVMNPSGKAPHNFFHPYEIGLMYSTSMCTNVQSFIENSYLGVKNITSTLILPAYRIFHTLIFDENSNVTISKDTCYVSPLVQFVVNSGAILRLDDINILSNGNEWRGVVVNEGGTLILSNNVLENYDVTVETGGTIIITDTLTIKNNHFIKIKRNACVCISSTALINLEDPFSLLDISPEVCYCSCSTVQPTSCVADISEANVQGLGTIFNHTTTTYIQNTTISSQKIFTGNEVKAGFNVTNTKPSGSVVITTSGDVLIKSDNGVLLDRDVYILQGGQLKIEPN